MSTVTYNTDNLVLLLTLWKQSLEASISTGRKDLTPFYLQVQELYEQGKITDADVTQLLEEGLSQGDFIELSTYIQKGPSGLHYNEAIEAGHKLQFMMLTAAQKEQPEHMRRVFSESMPVMDQVIDEVYQGTIKKEKLDILNSLPDVSVWDHDKAYEAYQVYSKL